MNRRRFRALFLPVFAGGGWEHSIDSSSVPADAKLLILAMDVAKDRIEERRGQRFHTNLPDAKIDLLLNVMFDMEQFTQRSFAM